MRAWAPRSAAVSESRRKTGIGASRSASSASIRSVPAPARESVVEAHSGQARGCGSAWAQWWQTRRPLWRWTISETSQLGQFQWCPQERQVSQGAKPRRLIITIALAPAARTPSSASQVSGVQRARARVGLAHVDQLDRRHPQAVDPARQLQARQLQPGLRARRRGAGDEHGAALLGAAAGDGAGVVAGVALLLVGGVVLLVDDDQAEVADRGEDGGAGADADAGLAAAQAPPLVVALAGREGRVEDREAVAEPGPEAGHRLRREADLGDEHDRPPAALQRRLDRGQVDLGLARAGDPVQQQLARRSGLAVEGGDDGVDGVPAARAAGRGARRGRRGRSRRGRGAGASCGSRSGRAPRSRRRVWRSEPTAAASSAPDISPARSASSTARCLTPSRPPPLSASSPAGRISARSSTLERTVRPPVPVPGGSTSCRPREGVEQYSRATQSPSRTSSAGAPASSASIGSASRSGGQLRGLGELDDDAEQLARPERHADDAADLQVLHRLRPAVVERAPQSAGGGQRLDPEDRSSGRGYGRRGTARPQPWRASWRRRMLPAVSLNLSPGEQVIFQGHPSWRAILGFYLKGIVVAVDPRRDREADRRQRHRLPGDPRRRRR